ncbi:N-6 DNA methylase (plasmid) [Cereibacter azotoformans]|uniref:site-specific DNA-methyltransferase (adenine-specific) n=1 Tax=Cereibacter sphaeroides (strain ATCC 17025 / ATH 2.4.3) TaxID=349102 RepID=A4X0R4_CERS5|nr:N-6 DNA methylase [Cereibacter azotoformans]ULB12804.1 N-6 DNA methylase [Cereibacter azotoformans]
MARLSQKHSGAYFTPDPVVSTLVRWAIHSPSDRMLDPSCGDGRFIAAHRNSVGIEQDAISAATAMARAPWALVHEGDFFTWATETSERFDCAAGNPPFIRYQTFKGAVRERALSLCRSLGVEFSGLASSWAPFLVATANLIQPGGRMAFVVPAEIGHAPYAAPLIEYLVAHFSRVHIVAVRAKLFPGLSEDCWLLYTEGRGGRTDTIRFTALETFAPGNATCPPKQGEEVSVSEWRSVWNRRLRPFVMAPDARSLYRAAAEHAGSLRFGDAASIGIGYVSGANDFFHLRPSLAEKLGIPSALLHPAVRNGRALPAHQLTKSTVQKWQADDDPVLLLCLPRTIMAKLPTAVRRYLDSDAGKEARKAYKCRVREPWFSVPDVQTPDYFLSYMSGISANLVRNAAGATCTNSVHGVRVRDGAAMKRVVESWTTAFAALSREIEGHPLGGGMLKLEPREATRILIPAEELLPQIDANIMSDAVTVMQRWRHYA